MKGNIMDNILKRAKDKIRVSIRGISFSSQHQGKVNVIGLGYDLQDKNPVKILDPNTAKPVHSIHVYKKADESIDTSTEPILEDLLYINKIITEMYISNMLGLESESVKQGFVFENNKCIDALLEIRKDPDTENNKQATIFDEITKRGKGKIKSDKKDDLPETKTDSPDKVVPGDKLIPSKENEPEDKVIGTLVPPETPKN